MRSRMSRGVLEWSGGEDLYMGSHHTVTGNIRGYTSIVPGPPEWFHGSTGRVHLPRRALWAVVGREPAPSGLGATPLGPMRLGLGETLKGAPPLAWGASPLPTWPPPPSRSHLEGPSPFLLLPINRGMEGGVRHHIQGAAPPLPNTSPPPQKLGEALPEY